MDNRPVYIANLRATALWVIGVVLLLRFIDAVATLALIFALIVVLAMVLHPAVGWLERHGFPRGLAAVLVSTAFMALFIGTAALMMPTTIKQALQFATRIQGHWPEWQASLLEWLSRYPGLEHWVLENLERFISEISQHVPGIFLQFGRYTLNLVGALIAIGIVYVMMIFVLARPEPLVRGLLGAMPEHHREAAKLALQRALRQVQAFAGATAFNMVAIGVLTWIGLKAIGLPNAELFAVIAAVLEALPTLGPILAAVPPLVMSFAVEDAAWWYPLLVLAVFTAIQQLEAHLLAPLILARQTQLHPLTVVFAILTLGMLGGILGAILAIPLVAVVKAIYEEFYYKQKVTDESALDRDVLEVLGTRRARSGFKDAHRARRGLARRERELEEERQEKQPPSDGADEPPDGAEHPPAGRQ